MDRRWLTLGRLLPGGEGTQGRRSGDSSVWSNRRCRQPAVDGGAASPDHPPPSRRAPAPPAAGIDPRRQRWPRRLGRKGSGLGGAERLEPDRREVADDVTGHGGEGGAVEIGTAIAAAGAGLGMNGEDRGDGIDSESEERREAAAGGVKASEGRGGGG